MSYSQLIYKISLGLKSWGVFTLNVFFEQQNWAPGGGYDIPVSQTEGRVFRVFPSPCRPDWEAGRRTGLGAVSLRARLRCSLGELEAPGRPSGEPAFRWAERTGVSVWLGVLLAQEPAPAQGSGGLAGTRPG